MASSERFGYEWHKYHYILPQYEDQFKKWVAPWQPQDFVGKTVLDAGCGMGRNSLWPLQYGATKVVAFDLDGRSLDAARHNLKDWPQADVRQGNIENFDCPERFDLIFSIGVIHHLERPDVALRNLVRLLNPGGKILIWVYGFESNEWIVRWINPVRKHLTSRLPLPLAHVLSYFCSVPLYLFVKIFPQRHPYLKQLKHFRFDHTHSIVFDQLIPKVANYWTKAEAEALLTSIPELTDVTVQQVNDNSWTVVGARRS